MKFWVLKLRAINHGKLSSAITWSNLNPEILNGLYFFQEHWATALQTLDLTLDEVIHIRSVLTKAELEGLPLDGSLKEDVEKGKVSGFYRKDFNSKFDMNIVRCHFAHS